MLTSLVRCDVKPYSINLFANVVIISQRVFNTDMYYLLDTGPPIRVVCKNVATVNIPPKWRQVL